MTKDPKYLRNPQLDGSPFFWPEGDVAVLCLHGFTATTVEVRKIAAYLKNQGITTKGPLLPGHGTNPYEMNNTRWEDWLGTAEKALLELMQNYKKIFVLGESMGGLLTLHLAAKYPSLLGIMVFAPAVKIHKLWISKFIWPFKSFMQKGKPKDSIPQQSYTVFPLKAAASLYDFQKIVRKELNLITVPAIIFQGKLDDTVDPLGAVYAYENLGSSDKDFVFLEDSNHIILLDQQLPTVQEICLEFIQRCVKSNVGE